MKDNKDICHDDQQIYSSCITVNTQRGKKYDNCNREMENHKTEYAISARTTSVFVMPSCKSHTFG